MSTGVAVETERVPVLIVGAGLAGLASAVFLARRGIRVLLVERHSGTSLFPRAVGQNQRTMELLGFGGVAGDVPTVGPDAAKFRVRVAGSLRGPAFREEVSDPDTGDRGVLSPAGLGTAGQHELEPLLRRHAETLGATLRFDTELISFDQDDDGITAVLRDRERVSRVRADYLVAADGNRSSVREALGVDRHGPGSLGHNISIIFDADLADLIDPAQPTLHVLHTAHTAGVFVTVDHTRDRHLLTVDYDPATQSLAEFTTDRCRELIRSITEAPDLHPRIQAVRPWEMAAAIADRFRVGRVLLAGDAAKVTPPSGGFGGNTAIGDAYDLAWKLAAVLDTTAGPALLDTYDTERRPIADRVVAEVLRLLAARGPDTTTDTGPVSDRQRALELTLGFRYRSTAVCIDDTDPADSEDPYHPTGRPGFRAPHLWLHHNGEKQSTIDLFGHGFVLLTGPDNHAWATAAATTTARLGTTITTHTIHTEPALTEFRTRYGLTTTGATLIRPDGIIAWRTPGTPDNPTRTLHDTLTTILAR
ncbi:FAD-dependent oxidoreductase [Nocardia terpenica]|uniref:FAD-dependent oxidoreductase n=1 Tax=Nocardia terpenica TaxID=455432 RepID=A0A291RI15_9NOCA|nr:FAD-dependent oxidoreductase [Nocardia terpenica]